jgi:uncharacterized protein with HEPN domain
LRDDAVLLDIVKAARLAQAFTQGFDKPAFLGDLKTQSAVLHQLLVVGEAVKRLSQQFRDQYPAIPWKAIAGMRNILIHHYDTVDLDEVWKTVSVDVAALIAFVESVPAQPGDKSEA